MPKQYYKVPEPTLRRLPWYVAYAKLALKHGEHHISSTQIAHKIGIEPAIVAKDFSYVDITGKPRVGYDINELVTSLDDFLGFVNTHKAFVFGAGSLGSSLMMDGGLSQYGLDVVAAFDVKPELVGSQINRIPIHHLSHFKELETQLGIEVGILTVPVEQAQEVADIMVAGGIKAIWNFTPYRIVVPENIVVQNTSLYSHLAVMYNRLSESKVNNQTSKEKK